MLLVAVGGVVAVVERELLGARLAVAVRTEKRHPAPVKETVSMELWRAG